MSGNQMARCSPRGISSAASLIRICRIAVVKRVVPTKRMKKVSVAIVAGLITFSIGVVVAVLWMTRSTPELTNAEAPSAQCFPLFTQKVDSLKISEEGYFPQAAFYADRQRDQLVRSWYARYLAQMKEPSLLDSDTSENNGIYRFTWLRSFHSKVVVRVWTDVDGGMLTVKELTPEHENLAGHLSVDQTRRLTTDELAEFVRLFNKLCFWTLPSTPGDAIATDGAWWVFEVNSAGYYQVIARQAPEPTYRDLCLYMLKVSGLPLDASKGEIY